MAKHKYTTSMIGAKAVGRDLPISIKNSVEVCRFIRGKSVLMAKGILRDTIALKRAIPYRRYTWDLGHKKGMASGRFPIKTSSGILQVLESAEANAQFKGMNTARLFVAHIAAHKASAPMRGGRKRGQSAKRAHIEVILQEHEGDAKKEMKRSKAKEASSGERK
ncbi:50S ribosomal protein L22 [Candidatus Woesearchaeota archaeon]|nr:50S ribosomal protein L22 [Candidatus Woesearchaeota archaeon]